MSKNDTMDMWRAVKRLEENALALSPVDVDGINWTIEDMRVSVCDNLTNLVRGQVRLSKVSKRDVGLMLAAYGATSITIEKHAGPIARMARADIANHSWSGRL